MQIFNLIGPLRRQNVEDHVAEIMVAAIGLALEPWQMSSGGLKRNILDWIENQHVLSRRQIRKIEIKMDDMPFSRRHGSHRDRQVVFGIWEPKSSRGLDWSGGTVVHQNLNTLDFSAVQRENLTFATVFRRDVAGIITDLRQPLQRLRAVRLHHPKCERGTGLKRGGPHQVIIDGDRAVGKQLIVFLQKGAEFAQMFLVQSAWRAMVFFQQAGGRADCLAAKSAGRHYPGRSQSDMRHADVAPGHQEIIDVFGIQCPERNRIQRRKEERWLASRVSLREDSLWRMDVKRPAPIGKLRD